VGLWNLSALRRSYEKLLSRARDGQKRLIELNAKAAARESLLVGRDLIGAVLRDPLLPPEIIGGVQIRELAQAIGEYQALSRNIWDGVMADQ